MNHMTMIRQVIRYRSTIRQIDGKIDLFSPTHGEVWAISNTLLTLRLLQINIT